MSEASGAYAAELCERIDAGDLDPGAVELDPFVSDEHVLTPALWERLPEPKREAYNDRVADRDAKDLQREQIDLGARQQAALDTLETAFADDGPPTETVELGDAVLEVRTQLPGHVEQAIETIRDEFQKPDTEQSFAAVSEELIEAIPALIVDDDEPDDDPYDWSSEAVWRAYYDRHGSIALGEVFDVIASPALDRMEDLESFRGGSDGRGSGGGRGRDGPPGRGPSYNGP